ncbi:MAG: UvrD-helicase domain-containing protein, partial [Anaerovoracaceae bacterium]
MYLTGLLKEFEEIFREMKADRNMVDFDDVMHYAILILRDDMAADEYRKRFRYIFIDEFQDSNMLQEAIVGRITDGRNLFMVGDVKQSIYKFRLAEPEIFRRKYQLYARQSEENSVKIDLNSNFRSKLLVTETVNRVFSSAMEGYDENARLKCTVDEVHPGMATQCHIVDGSEAEDIRGDLDPEAQLVAELIRESLGNEIYDVKKGVARKVEYRDIVVLSRSRSAIGRMERFLNNEGIPAYGENTGGYFETVEVQVFVNLLRIIDNTRQDIPLISVMRSPVFDFHVRELAAVRIEKRDGSLYDAVRAFAEADLGGDEDAAALAAKIEEMFHQIACWKELKNTVTLEELTRILLYDTGYFDYCSGLPAGKRRISNLRLLVEKAGQFEQNSHSGLYGFISYIEAMKKNNISIGEAKVLGEGENVVRVMTVHKSKGLEFPIVILTGMGRMIRYRGAG